MQDIIDGEIYNIELNNLEGNGNLEVEILEGVAVDTGELKSELLKINTKITIDNITPEVVFKGNEVSSGRVKAILQFNEKAKDLEAARNLYNKISPEKQYVIYTWNKDIGSFNLK